MLFPEKCPKCEVVLEGEKVKPDERAIIHSTYANWSRVQLVTKDNRAHSFKCPDCHYEWPIPWMPSR